MARKRKLSKAESYDLTLNRFRYALYFYFEQLFLCPLVIYVITVIFLYELTAFYAYMHNVQYNLNLLLDTIAWIIYGVLLVLVKIAHAGLFGHSAQIWLAKQLAGHITYAQALTMLSDYFKKSFGHWQIHASLALSTFYVIETMFFAKLGGEHEKDIVLRGVKIKNLGKIKNIYKFIRKNENKHTFVAGTTGAGKTQTFLNIMNYAFAEDEKRGVRNIIFDLKGDFFCRFYNDYKGDRIINVFDERSLRWDFLQDVRDRADLDVLCTSFVRSVSSAANTVTTGTDEFFSMRAKQFLRDIFTVLKQHNFTESQMVAGRTLDLLDNQESMSITNSLEADLIKVLKKHKQSSSDRAFADTLATVRNATDFLYYFRHTQGKDGFTIIDYLNTYKYRNLYITVAPDKLEASRQFLSSFLEMLLLRMSSLPNTNKLRFRIFIDELSNFTRIPKLVNSLNFLRSKGIAIYISTQSFSALRSNYTQEEIASMLNACNNIVILKLIDTYSTKTASALIGQRQVIRADKNQFSTPGESKIDGFTLQQHTVTENAVLDSQIAALDVHKKELPLIRSAYTDFFGYFNNKWHKGMLKLQRYGNEEECNCFLPNAALTEELKEKNEKQEQHTDGSLDIEEQKEVKKQAQKQQHEQEQEQEQKEQEHEENIEDIDIFNLR